MHTKNIVAHIRPATAEDILPMVDLLQLLFSIEKDFHFDPKKHGEGLRLLVNSPDALVLVAEYDDQVRGMATAQIVISTAEGGPALLVEDVVVAEEYRGRSIGSRLLQKLASWAASRKINRMQLLADRHNLPALQFYKGCGWRTTDLICLRSYSDLF